MNEPTNVQQARTLLGEVPGLAWCVISDRYADSRLHHTVYLPYRLAAWSVEVLRLLWAHGRKEVAVARRLRPDLRPVRTVVVLSGPKRRLAATLPGWGLLLFGAASYLVLASLAMYLGLVLVGPGWTVALIGLWAALLLLNLNERQLGWRRYRAARSWRDSVGQPVVRRETLRLSAAATWPREPFATGRLLTRAAGSQEVVTVAHDPTQALEYRGMGLHSTPWEPLVLVGHPVPHAGAGGNEPEHLATVVLSGARH